MDQEYFAVKTIGSCTLCDKLVWNVVQVFTEGERAGTPKALGWPHEEARRVWLILANGNHCSTTVCGDCNITPETMPEVHRKMREAWAWDGTNGKREQVGGSTLTLVEQWRQGAWQLGETDNIPLGVLCEESWDEAMGREHGRS